MTEAHEQKDEAPSHAQDQIVLLSGREIRLTRLDQCLTYDGLIAGCPHRTLNDGAIHSAMQEAQKGRRDPVRTHVIEPSRRGYYRHPGDMPALTLALCEPRWQPPEFIPRITCVGEFKSNPVVADKTADYSALIVVWFQEEFAFPIEETVFSAIRQLDWDSLASDHRL